MSKQQLLAIIDLGAHSVRMEIVQFTSVDDLEILDNVSQQLFIGADVFRSGKISASNMRHATTVLCDYKKLMGEYGVKQYRAVATSAVREASNRDIFINKIKTKSGIEISVLDPAEELKLLYQSVKKILSNRISLKNHNAVLCSIGTGSTHFASIEKGSLKNAQFLKFGTVRLIEEFSTSLSAKRLRETIEPYVSTLANDVARMSPSRDSDLLILTGATVRALVSMNKSTRKVKHVASLSKKKFYEIFAQIDKYSVDEIIKQYHMPDLIARGLDPCCNLIDHLLKNIDTDRLIVPFVNTRDALLQAQMQRICGKPDPFDKEIISSVEFIGEKYRYNAYHARTVSDLALQLFDRLGDLHNLGQKERLILETATLLRDVGKFINPRQHHKHSFYIISNTLIPGFTEEDKHLVATVARYHRKASPKPSHPEYMSLSSDDRVKVCKLASIVKVAGALDREHANTVKIKKITHDNESLRITVCGQQDLTKEQWMLKNKCELFSDTFGLKILLSGVQ